MPDRPRAELVLEILRAADPSAVRLAEEEADRLAEAPREPLLLVTMNPPRAGAIVNVDGVRYRVARVLSWTGTVARLEIVRLTA